MLHTSRHHNSLLVSVAIASLLITASGTARPQPRPYQVTKEELHRFAAGLRAAVEAGDPHLVAGHRQFPLRVNTTQGGFYFIKREDFVSEYDKIFSPRLRAAILKQDMSALEQSAGDISIGDGMVTAAGVCGDRGCAAITPRVTTIDVRGP
jgi:hypothetical protein